MTVTLALPPETERLLKASAKSRGVSLEHYAVEILNRENPLVAEGKNSLALDAENNALLPTREERLKAWLAMTSHPRPLPYEADDSRESIYGEDRVRQSNV